MLTYIDTDQGYQVVDADGSMFAVVTTKTPGEPAVPAGHGIAPKPARPPGRLKKEAWTFEFSGRPKTEEELRELLTKLPAV